MSCTDRRRPCAQSRVPTLGQALFLALGILGTWLRSWPSSVEWMPPPDGRTASRKHKMANRGAWWWGLREAPLGKG